MFRYIFIFLLLSSCSASWHHTQACKKDSVYCSQVMVIDTFVVRDTFTCTRIDTTNVIDTITIDTGSIRVQIIRNHDVIRTTITQKPDTTFLTITKTIPPRIVYKTNPWCKYLILIFAIALLWKILR
jgi:hypothetical protein